MMLDSRSHGTYKTSAAKCSVQGGWSPRSMISPRRTVKILLIWSPNRSCCTHSTPPQKILPQTEVAAQGAELKRFAGGKLRWAALDRLWNVPRAHHELELRWCASVGRRLIASGCSKGDLVGARSRVIDSNGPILPLEERFHWCHLRRLQDLSRWDPQTQIAWIATRHGLCRWISSSSLQSPTTFPL